MNFGWGLDKAGILSWMLRMRRSAFEPDVLRKAETHHPAGRDRRETLHLVRVRVVEAVEQRNPERVLLGDQRLHLSIHPLPLGVVRLGLGLDQQLVEPFV